MKVSKDLLKKMIAESIYEAESETNNSEGLGEVYVIYDTDSVRAPSPLICTEKSEVPMLVKQMIEDIGDNYDPYEAAVNVFKITLSRKDIIKTEYPK